MSAGGAGAMYAAMGASAISSLGTAYAQSQALKARGRYEETIGRSNAALANFEGEETLQAGDIAAGRKNLETKQIVGAQRAAQGASGIDIGSGSSAMVRNATRLTGAFDELTIRNNAARAAWGYKIQGMQDIYQGEFAKFSGDAEAKQALLSGGMQAISGGLSIYANSRRFQNYRNEGGNGRIPDSYIPTDIGGA